MYGATSAVGATEGSQGRARFAPPLDHREQDVRALKGRQNNETAVCIDESESRSVGSLNARHVPASIALSGLNNFVLLDPGAARSARSPGYLLSRLRRWLSGAL